MAASVPDGVFLSVEAFSTVCFPLLTIVHLGTELISLLPTPTRFLFFLVVGVSERV